MKQFFIKKEITSMLFIITLILFSCFNFIYAFPKLNDELKNASFTEIEGKINDTLYQKDVFIESYGYIQSVLSKQEVNNFEVIKGNDNMLYLASNQTKSRDISNIIPRMRKLKEVVEKNNGQIITLIPPDKYIEGKSEPIKGYPYSYNNETADTYRRELEKVGIDILDYRDMFKKSSLPIQDIFYKTDHHWKIESSFQAFVELIDYLNKKDDLNLDSDYFLRDINHYNQILYSQSFIGSLGRKTGKVYGGVDDFTLIYPKYETTYTYDMDYYGQKTHREGRMDDTLINPAYFVEKRSDYLNIQYDLYSSYLDYNCSYAKIINKQNPSGLKVAFYKDSYSLPLITFFSQVCSEIDIIDPRYYVDNLDEYFYNNQFDYVFVSISPDLITEDLYIFYKQDK